MFTFWINKISLTSFFSEGRKLLKANESLTFFILILSLDIFSKSKSVNFNGTPCIWRSIEEAGFGPWMTFFEVRESRSKQEVVVNGI